MAEINYRPPPTLARFMVSEARTRIAAGPVGSGKTVSCIIELLRRAIQQDKADDGFRYTRFAILRQTLQQLKMTVLKDIMQWLRGIATLKVSDNTVFVEFGDVKSEWLMMPMEDPEDQRRLLSSQLTGAWISECIEVNADLVDAIAGRCGRYPGPSLGGCTWYGIIMDTNMPEEGSRWHELMEDPPEDWQVFKQPGGLEPDAENLEWLLQSKDTLILPIDHPNRLAAGRKYYERLAAGPNTAWINRYVHAKYGIDPSSTAVFGAIFFPRNTTYDIPWHVVDNIPVTHGATIIVGQDFGRDPAAVIGQVNMSGQLCVLDEINSRKMGLQKHITDHLRPRLQQDRYIGQPLCIVGDPAGIAKNSHYEETSFDLLKSHGFHAFPAPTNDLDPRLRAVEAWLLGARGTGAALIIDSRCTTLITALRSGYKFENLKTGETKPKPLKNEYSHLADALQYLALSANGGALGLINRRLVRRVLHPRQQFSSAAWT